MISLMDDNVGHIDAYAGMLPAPKEEQGPCSQWLFAGT